MGVKFSNNADTTLAGNISDSETIIALTGGGGVDFPALGTGDYFYMTLVNQAGTREVIKVEYRNADTLGSAGLPCTRGVDGSSAVAWTSADCKVQLRLPSIVVEEIVDDIATNVADIATNAADIATNAADIAALEGTLEAPSGLNMYFYENVAPTGWTINSGPADSLLSVKGGSEDYNVTGGQTAGSWTPTTHIHDMGSHNHTGPVHSHTVDDHSHDIPDHKHEQNQHSHTFSDTFTVNAQNSGDRSDADGSGSDNYSQIGHTHNGSVSGTTEYDSQTDTGWAGDDATDPGGTGNTSTKTMGDTESVDPGDTNTGAESADDRPKAAVGIIAEKD